VAHLDAVDVVAVAQEVHHFRVGLDPRAVGLGVDRVRDAEPERVDRAVGDFDRSLHVRREVRFDLAGFRAREHASGDPHSRQPSSFSRK